MLNYLIALITLAGWTRVESFPKIFEIRNNDVEIKTYKFDSDLRNKVYLNFYWQNNDHVKNVSWVFRQRSWTFFVVGEKVSERNSSSDCQYNTTLKWKIDMFRNKTIIKCDSVEMFNFNLSISNLTDERAIPNYVSVASSDTATRSIRNDAIDGKYSCRKNNCPKI